MGALKMGVLNDRGGEGGTLRKGAGQGLKGQVKRTQHRAEVAGSGAGP